MKRELAFALGAQSQFTESLGRTRSSKSQPSNRSKVQIEASNESEVRLNAANDQNRVRIHTSNAYRRNKRLKTGRKEGESVIIKESKGENVRPIAGGEVEGVKHEFPVEAVAPRRFTRSALKLKNGSLGLDNGSYGNFVASERVEMDLEIGKKEGGRGNSHKKTGLRMSKMKKKIELKNRPTTVEELLHTGLLEGYPVSYKRDKKGNVLRGTIKDAGILCYCSLCKGSRVVMPLEFEAHARNLYRHEYICLENGKSLLQVVKACMSISSETLEETIQNLIGPKPSKEPEIFMSCKGENCDSCVDSVKFEASLINTISNSITPQATPKTSGLKLSEMSKNKMSEKVRSPEPVPATKSSASSELFASSRKKGQGKMKRKALDPPIAATSPGCDSVDIEKKSQPKMTKSSSRLDESSKSLNCSSSRILSQNKNEGKTSKKLLKSSPVSNRKSDSKSGGKITRKDQRMHRLVFEENGLPEGTEVGYYSQGQKMLEGYKKGSGIFCHCCNTVVSASQFEAHAGCAKRKKPYGYIYTSNGVSLHELAVSLLKGRTHSDKYNDDLCIICADGGNLLLCDGCPRAFHKECASLSAIPRGKWYCRYCQNMFQREKFVKHNANALAAGRVTGGGVDPIEQITTRCIRIVKNPSEAVVITCVLCRGYDYSKSGFGARTVIICDQCEKEYHIGCLKEHNMADLKELPKEKWICCMDCLRIYSELQNLTKSEAEKIQESLLDVIKKKEIVRGLKKDINNELDVRWSLLSGKTASRQTRLLLSQAVAIFHECFDPIVDPESGHDFIPTMVYGRKIKGQDFGGMYCAVLTVNSVVVSAGVLRVFGQDRAELPLVATSNANQGKGYFQLLFSCIEKLLALLKVKSLVLPAAEIAESIWTDRFSFKKISPQQLIEYKKDFWQMLTFKGTSMLEKQVPSCRIIGTDATSSS